MKSVLLSAFVLLCGSAYMAVTVSADDVTDVEKTPVIPSLVAPATPAAVPAGSVVTNCSTQQRWKTFGKYNINISHLFCGEVHASNGGAATVKGGHHVSSKSCKVSGDSYVCPHLKLNKVSKPYQDGTFNVNQVYVKSATNGRAVWAAKQDEHGGSSGSTMFPPSLTQKQVIDTVLSALRAIQGTIDSETSSRPTAYCVPASETRKISLQVVVRTASARNPAGVRERLTGTHDVITAYPKKCVVRRRAAG